MLNNKEKELINCIINIYKKSDDFKQEKNNYNNLISQISNAPIFSKIKELESVLKIKYYLEFFYAYQQGCKLNKDIAEEDLFDKDVDEIININSLYNEFNYLSIAYKSRKIRQYILTYFETSNNISMLSNIYQLFEIYNNINYEILKLSYLSGYGRKHSLNKFNANTIDLSVTILPKEQDKNLYTFLGQKIKHCRKCFQYTQAEMGALFSIERTSITNYEKGKTKPKIDFLLQLSEHCNIALYDLCSPKVSIDEFKINYPKSHFEIL